MIGGQARRRKLPFTPKKHAAAIDGLSEPGMEYRIRKQFSVPKMQYEVDTALVPRKLISTLRSTTQQVSCALLGDGQSVPSVQKMVMYFKVPGAW